VRRNLDGPVFTETVCGLRPMNLNVTREPFVALTVGTPDS
jgi:hypothetical protein